MEKTITELFQEMEKRNVRCYIKYWSLNYYTYGREPTYYILTLRLINNTETQIRFEIDTDPGANDEEMEEMFNEIENNINKLLIVK